MKLFSISGLIFRKPVLPAVLCIFFVLQITVTSGETLPAGTKATSVLIEEAQELLANGLFREASESLSEIAARLEALTDPESSAARSACLYQLGFCRIMSDDFSGAADSFKKFITEYPDHEQTPAARFMVLESYARQRQFAEMALWMDHLKSSGAFGELIRFLKDEKNTGFRRHTVLTLLTGYAEQGDLENLRMFFSFCDDAVLADAGLNSALISGGDQAFEKKDYPLALILYRTARRTEEAVPVCRREISALEAELAKQPPWVPLSERDRQRLELQAEQDRLDGLKQAVSFFIESGYDLNLQMRMAQCYDAMQRYRLSLAVYNDIYKKFPGHRLAEQCRASAFQALLALDEQEPAIAAGQDYLAGYPQGRFEDEIIASLMQLYLLRGELTASAELGRRALEALPNRRSADQITYLLGVAVLQQQNWPEALGLFSSVKNRWPQSPYVQEADYWYGMCHLFSGRFGDAVTAFESYLNNPAYRPARFADDVTYRLGVAQYGAEDFAEAEGTLKKFLVLYPEHSLVSEAFSMLGDLRGAEGDLDTAVALYQTAIQKAVDAEQDGYAVFQAAQVYELEQRYERIIELMEAYIARRGADARLADAGLWIGKSCKAGGNRRQALEIYLKTLADFGNDPALDGIEQVQEQILNDLKDGAGSSDLAFTVGQLSQAFARARQKNERTLSLRLAALLVRLGGEPERTPAVDMLTSEGLEAFSPLPLIVLAETFAEAGDFSAVEQLAGEYRSRFPGSNQLLDMIHVEAAAALSARQYEKAIDLTAGALEQFSGDPRTVLSWKLQGDARRLLKDWAGAVESYQKIFSIRKAHGSMAPEALYWIGVCRREQGEVEKAFAFFQRVYVLYKGWPEWVAKAYEASADCLEKLGRSDEVILTLQEMTATPSIRNTPEVQRALETLSRLK